MRYFETHFHLDYLKTSPEEVLSLARKAGVDKFLTIAVSPDNQDQAWQLAQDFDDVYCTQGVHPHEAITFDDKFHNKLKTQALKNKVVAIGEIGLDYHYRHSPEDVQRAVFEKQLQLATDLSLPVVIHTREADEDTLSILKNFKVSGVLHSYTSGRQLAEYALDAGFSLGFNGIITFKTSKNVQEIAQMAPLESILLETDAPFLTPVPHRGKENGPQYLPFVAKKLSELKEVSVEELSEQTYQNGLRVFNLNSLK